MCGKSKFRYEGAKIRYGGLIPVLSRVEGYLISFVLLLGLAAGVATADIDTGLVGHWKLDEGSGDTAYDSSGNGNYGILEGDPQWVAGWIGGALEFDGVDDYVDCGDGSSLDINDVVTIATWVKTNDSGGGEWNPYVHKGDHSYGLKHGERNAVEFVIYDGTWYTTEYSVDASFNDEWHHLVGTYDGSMLRLYVDGILKVTSAHTGSIDSQPTYPIYIGSNSEETSRLYEGKIDEARIYNRALPGADIVWLFTGKPPTKALNPIPLNDSVVEQTTPTLTWVAGVYAASHDVYLSDSFAKVNAATSSSPMGPGEVYKARNDANSFTVENLTEGVTYYWRADEVNDLQPGSPWRGDIWSFTIASKSAFQPIPGNGSLFVDPNVTLSWTAGTGSVIHFFYFGDNLEDVQAGTGGTSKGTVGELNYHPGLLEREKTYYWRVDEFDGMRRHTGNVWSFTTARPGGGLKGSYYNGIAFEQLVLERIDPQINFDWGNDSPAPGVNTDAFSVIWAGELEIPFSGIWTFYTNINDGVRLWVNNELIVENWADRYSATENWGDLIELVAGKCDLKMEYYENWEIATAQLLWEGPKTPKQLIPQAAFSPTLRASNPNPYDGAVAVKQTPTLQWTAGDNAAHHEVYFGDDQTTVENAHTTTIGIYHGQQELDQTKYTPIEAPLEWNKTYYWRIDEVEADGVTINKSLVWSFTVADYVVVEDFEDYNDFDNRIFDVWADYPVNNTGMTVGHFDLPFAERRIVHNGFQSMYMLYDNDGTVNEGTNYEQSGTLFYSEAEREWADAQDWTRDGVNSLTLWFRGISASVGSFAPQGQAEGPPITMTANGTDIWGNSDQFHFAYKKLSGEGSITAKVVSVSNTDPWAKVGVMIRQSLDPGSVNTAIVITPENGVSFQRRPLIDAGSEDTTIEGITAPHWVRLTRSGNTFIGQYSANGATWTTLDSVNMPILLDVYVGLCLTSHNVDATCTAEFSNVTMTGTVTDPDQAGGWLSQDIGIESNIAEPMYVVLADSAGNSATAKHPDPAATIIDTWTPWNIPFTDFASVNMQAIKKMAIGVGDRANTQPGGAGDLYIDDIGLMLPAE